MRILVIEDDLALARHLRQGLEEAGYTVEHAADARSALRAFVAAVPQMVILDLGLPDRDGTDLLTDLKRLSPACPVLILSARDGVEDRISGLDLGAGDYMVKPFDFPELLARIRVQLRTAQVRDLRNVRVADLELDLRRRTLTRGGEPVEIPSREFDLLLALVEANGAVVSRSQLSKEVWRVERRMTSIDNLIEVHVSRLRERVDAGRENRLIETVRGVGYRIRPEVFQ